MVVEVLSKIMTSLAPSSHLGFQYLDIIFFAALVLCPTHSRAVVTVKIFCNCCTLIVSCWLLLWLTGIELDRMVGCFSMLEICMIFSGIIKASPQLENFQISYRTGASGLWVWNTCCFLQERPTLKSERQQKALTIVCNVFESLAQPWTNIQRRVSYGFCGFC